MEMAPVLAFLRPLPFPSNWLERERKRGTKRERERGSDKERITEGNVVPWKTAWEGTGIDK